MPNAINTAALTPDALQMAWHIVPSKAEFNRGTKVEGTMYFIEETGEIYRGSRSYTESVVFYENEDNLPAVSAAATNKLYLNKETMTAKVTDGTKWYTLAGGNSGSGETPVDTSTVTRVDWDGTEKMLDLYHADTKLQSVLFNGLGVSLQYDSATGKIQLLDAANEPVGDSINIDADRFVSGGEYIHATHEVVLYFDGKTGEESTDKITIPVGDLVDVYKVASTETVALTVDEETNTITGAVRLSSEEGNVLIIKPDGLYVNLPADLSSAVTQIQAAVDTANAAKAAAEKATADVAAMDARVTNAEAAIKALQEGGVGGGGTIEVDGVTIVIGEGGKLSVGKIDMDAVTGLTDAMKGKLDSSAVSTALPLPDDASDDKVLSEKAIVSALTWKQGM